MLALDLKAPATSQTLTDKDADNKAHPIGASRVTPRPTQATANQNGRHRSLALSSYLPSRLALSTVDVFIRTTR